MNKHDGELAPTARLRFITRVVGADMPEGSAHQVTAKILQQWWAPAVPSYMISDGVGEWRDVMMESMP